MQSVAQEMNLAETAFLVPMSALIETKTATKTETKTETKGETKGETKIDANNAGEENDTEENDTEENQTEGRDYQLRWFTPAVEVDLCGHATLASAHLLWEESHLPPEATARFHTRSGLLTATRSESGEIELDFPAEPAVALTSDRVPPELLSGLGVEPRYLGQNYVGQNRMDLLVEVANEATLRQLRPDLGLLARLPVRGIIVTAPADTDSRFDFVSRFFAPAVGVDEDPVTGSAHCCLGPHWQQRLHKTEFTAYQASQRGGTIHIKVHGDRVKLSGHAVTTLRGELSDIASE